MGFVIIDSVNNREDTAMTLRTRCLEASLCIVIASALAGAQTPPPSVDKALKTGQEAAKARRTRPRNCSPRRWPSRPPSSPPSRRSDRADRTVTLKGPQGNLVDVYVDESHKGFDSLKVGESIKATYYESVVVHVRKEGEPRRRRATSRRLRRLSRRGETVARQVIATVTIKANRSGGAVGDGRRSKGRVVSMRVQDPKR